MKFNTLSKVVEITVKKPGKTHTESTEKILKTEDPRPTTVGNISIHYRTNPEMSNNAISPLETVDEIINGLGNDSPAPESKSRKRNTFKHLAKSPAVQLAKHFHRVPKQAEKSNLQSLELKLHPYLNAPANQLGILACVFFAIPIGWYLVNFPYFWSFDQIGGQIGLLFYVMTLLFNCLWLVNTMDQNVDRYNSGLSVICCFITMLIETILYSDNKTWFYIFGWVSFCLWFLVFILLIYANYDHFQQLDPCEKCLETERMNAEIVNENRRITGFFNSLAGNHHHVNPTLLDNEIAEKVEKVEKIDLSAVLAHEPKTTNTGSKRNSKISGNNLGSRTRTNASLISVANTKPSNRLSKFNLNNNNNTKLLADARHEMSHSEVVADNNLPTNNNSFETHNMPLANSENPRISTKSFHFKKVNPNIIYYHPTLKQFWDHYFVENKLVIQRKNVKREKQVGNLKDFAV